MTEKVCERCGKETERVIQGQCRACYDRRRYVTNIVYFRVYYRKYNQRIRGVQKQYQRGHVGYFVQKRRLYASL